MDIFITVDVEEWYHLDYLKNKQTNKSITVLNNLYNLLELFDEYGVKSTFFVLSELVDNNKKLINEICNKDHEIACHGLDHELLHNKNNKDFKVELIKAKEILETTIGQNILGYRASCFSISDQKLEIIKNVGFRYDSSYIKFKQHELYGDLSIENWNQYNSNLYFKNSFFEYELPTVNFFNMSIPISGGGYFRLFPWFLFKRLFNDYMKNNDMFILYLHPYELSNDDLFIKDELTFKENFRMNYGRKNCLAKLENFLKYLDEMNANFFTFKDYLIKKELI